MPPEKEVPVKKVDWGDGTEVIIRRPKLEVIPGDSVICPAPCNPVGETEDEWKKNEEKTKKKK